ncbi:flavodoxin domain-containing protein [Terrisporobacter petrolearius]|nr:flavodoxin domain-containing protein [Terrisporobacter petrolearius]MCC3866051.1 flavodoxin domain-containing protein [Terrisporobacter petrolearius]
MKNIGIVYFSGTGNTKFVANNIKRELEIYNKEVNLINIEKGNINLKDYDSIIIGGPVYVDRYPEILIKYMEENLKGFTGKCMLFSTQA